MKPEQNKIKCVGIIMDGNRRWAKQNGKISLEGHKEGYKKLKESLEWIKESGINEAIVYAFSTENWKRTEEEVGALMKLLTYALSNEIDSLLKKGVKLKFAGDLTMFPDNFRSMLDNATKVTQNNGPLTLTVALSYGGRAEILDAIKKIAKLPEDEIENITEDSIEKYFWTCGMSDPDLIIRTGGECRMSNFLPYQSVYSELFFTKTLWPDFSREEFEAILKDFGERKRNRGR
jgi:undecaprenyl diphosphate synthase